MQRLLHDRRVQLKARTGTAGDAHERDADRVANHAMQSPRVAPGNCACGGTCPKCRKSDAGLQSVGLPAPGGVALDHPTRAFFETRLGHDFSDVQVHHGATAASLAASFDARALTVGRDIVFGERQYRPHDSDGRRLLAHELAHVVQQRNDGPRVDRQPLEDDGPQSGDALQVNGPYVSGEISLAGGETVTALAAPVGDQILVELPAPYDNAHEPFYVPLFLVSAARAGGQTPVAPAYAVDLGPADMLPELPDGVVVELDPGQLPPEVMARMAPGASQGGFDMRGYYATQAGRLTGTLADSHLMTHGFAAAGDYSIGLVGYPNTTNLRALRNLDIAQSPILFGHTILTVRVDGRIAAMTSFGPKSLLAAAADTYSGAHAGVPGQIIQHLDPQPFPLSMSGTHGFPNTGAISVEYPVTPEMARQMAARLQGAEADELLRYAAYAEKCPVGQNCVAWAIDQVEDALGGPVGQQGQTPLRHASGLDTARQGQFQGMAEDALEFQRSGGRSGTALADMPNATGPAVAGKMSTGMRVLKWGGRILWVGGLAYSGYRINTAGEAERPLVIAEEAIATAHPLGMVVSEFYIQPMTELAAGRGDATLLILPIPYVAPMVRLLEPEKHDPEGGRLIRRAVLGNDPAAAFSVYRRLFMMGR